MILLLYTIKNLLDNIYIPSINLLDIVEILIITTILYNIIKYIKNSRIWIILRGLFLLGILYCIVYLLSFNALLVVFENITVVLTVAIVTIFQPEIRKILENLGTKKYDILKNKKRTNIKQKITDKEIEDITNASYNLSMKFMGALIVIENEIPLKNYIDTGIILNSNISSELLINIFEKNTPLHDGAVIIQNNKIASATCYLPLSENNKINKKLGTRHRAAIGITETTDSIAIIVSEETGAVSVVYKGKIKQNLKEKDFVNELKKFQKETAIAQKKNIKQLFFSNTLKKCLSAILSVFIWIVLMNISNPICTKTFYNIPIEIKNDYILTNIEKTYKILSEQTTTVTIKGNRKEIEKVREEDIIIYADFSKVSALYTIKLESQINKISNAEVFIKNDIMKIELENMLETEYDIQINKIGTPDPEHYVYNIIPETLSISIRSGQSTMKKIDKICIDVDINNIEADKEFSAIPKVYDKNGDLIDYKKLVLSHNQINGIIQTYKIKKIPINILLNVQDDFTKSVIKHYKSEVSEIQITAPDETLDNITQINIEVPLKITEKQATNNSFAKNIVFKDYIDISNIYIVNEELSTNILIEFNEKIEKTIKIPTSKIVLKNKDNNFEYKFKEEYAYLTIEGNRNNILSITQEMSYYIDVQKLKESLQEDYFEILGIENITIKNVDTKIEIIPKEINIETELNYEKQN